MRNLSYRVSVAPMMAYTDRHCRFFLRLFSPHALLYTEMVTSAAILRGDRHRLLGFDPAEHPVALQLGGSDPNDMAAAAAFGEEAGYDEININIGCPSDRVQSGTFGACLMREPARVADCVAAMRARVKVPVTVKTRIGIEDGEGGVARAQHYDDEDYQKLHTFITNVATAGCDTFVVHARKAILRGFSPKDNREIPPLRYDVVLRLRKEFPALKIIVNGGIRGQDQALGLLKDFDGVMIGREAYANPYFLSQLEEALTPQSGWAPPTRLEVFERLMPYADKQVREGQRLHSVTRHMAGMFAGQPGARQWRRYFSESAVREGADAQVLRQAYELLARGPARYPSFSPAEQGESAA